MNDKMKRSHRAIDEQLVRENPDPMAPATLLISEPPKWEYKSVLLHREADLAGYGSEGWELVSVIPQAADQAVFYFRRQK